MALTKQNSLLRPLTELTVASIFWGFGFIATIWALKFIGFPAVIFYRCLGAFVLGFFLLLIFRVPHSVLKNEFRLSLIPGFLMSLFLVMQAWGLVTVSATKSAFITVLYVVFVPVLAYFLIKEKLHPLHWLCVLISLVGTYLIANVQWGGWSFGDTLTLGNAFVAALHILAVDRIASKSQNSFALNVFQSMWACLFTLVISGLDPRWDLLQMDLSGWIGIISLAFGSSLLAFYLQVRAQKDLNPSVASILFLLESPVTYIFAYFILNERLTQAQWLGAILISASCLWAVRLQALMLKRA